MTTGVTLERPVPVEPDGVRIVVDHVTKTFGAGRTARTTAVDDVSLAFDPGARVGIVGESGSGKSTLGRMIVGLERPSSGAVEVGGLRTDAMTRPQVLAFRRQVQQVAQDTSSSFDPRLRLREALRAPTMTLLGLDRRAADARADEVLEALHLPARLAERLPREVSGGQRQRFALARALVVRPRWLVCDEAVSALDVSVQGTILNLVKSYCRTDGAGVVFISHGLPAVAFLAEHLVVMYRGRIVEQGPTARVVSDPQHPYTARLLAAHRGGDAHSGAGDPAPREACGGPDRSGDRRG
ncbi:ABC transporter ATP-binding protein [Mycolicibacterium palauense]|uniref:ABC transporter ATP-binding protein n=1 Tax=Mycolicibacterium palauense TaxID=2034511 RepID=UPI00159BEA1C|nr:ATP-binding cassette domain-containing protein [Mycolicibacterium palauense]